MRSACTSSNAAAICSVIPIKASTIARFGSTRYYKIEAVRAELVSIYNPDSHPKLCFPPSIHGIIPATKYCPLRVRLSESCPKKRNLSFVMFFPISFPIFGGKHIGEKEMQM